MKLKTLIGAALIAALPFAAHAVPVHQLDVVGNVNPSLSTYSPTGQLIFVGSGFATNATGLFASVVTLEEMSAATPATVFAMSNIDFSAPPQTVYSGGGFTFVANTFLNFDDVLPGRGFDAKGRVFGAFGSLPGMLSFSSQATSLGQTKVSFSSTTEAIPLPASVFMLISAFGGLGGLRLLAFRRRMPA